MYMHVCVCVYVLGARDIYLFSRTSITALGPTQPPVQCIAEFFSNVKRPGREVNHSLSSSAEVKN